MSPIIAIDGPASAGKSTTALAVASRLGMPYLDTGAMYRAVACAVKLKNVSPSDTGAVIRVSRTMRLNILGSNSKTRVWIDRQEVTDQIRTPEITKLVTPVCEIRDVREVLVGMQRNWCSRGIGILDGRDIGTVVQPDASLKIFMTARPEVRALRRAKQNGIDNDKSAVKDLTEMIIERDRRDSEREESPLMQAEDAILLDTSILKFEEQVDRIISWAAERFQFQRYRSNLY